MAGFNKFNAFIESVFEKEHDFSSDVFKIMLTNVAPVATNSLKGDLTEISSGNGYTSGGTPVSVASSSQLAGVYKATLSGDTVFTASGGNIASFRYVVLYNDTSVGDALVGWWDYGSSISPSNGETFTARTDGIDIITAS